MEGKIMKKYKILNNEIDFTFIQNSIIGTSGSREKRIVVDEKTKEIAYFKYEKYNCSESCSEKLSYEIDKILGYPCAHIELAKDEAGRIGILSYLFVDNKNSHHNDAISYINKNSSLRKEIYTISNIKNCLDEIDLNLFPNFLKIMVFDALVGETDRHEENWGIISTNDNKYELSPLYDNGCNLLRYFKDEKFAEKYYNDDKKFNKYIRKPKSLIYKENSQHKYNLIELIEELYKRYPQYITNEINDLDKLTDEKIVQIVNKIPDSLLTVTKMGSGHVLKRVNS